MTLAPDAQGASRKVVIQLMPAPFSQGWVGNIRKLARAKWYDDITVNRVQDNYVVQWGDPNYDNPEGEGEAKPLPEGLSVMGEEEYVVTKPNNVMRKLHESWVSRFNSEYPDRLPLVGYEAGDLRIADVPIGVYAAFNHGFPYSFKLITSLFDGSFAPAHCYGMVGVGRGYSPDTGSGAELYTVIGHAPRHLDRNIALVGRIIFGMEHLSSLPRGSGALGFYTAEEADKRTPILSVRVASDLPDGERPQFEYLSTESDTFAQYADARANRRDPFFIVPAGGADICNIPVPVRPISAGE